MSSEWHPSLHPLRTRRVKPEEDRGKVLESAGKLRFVGVDISADEARVPTTPPANFDEAKVLFQQGQQWVAKVGVAALRRGNLCSSNNGICLELKQSYFLQLKQWL
jgi:hypothetical protein